MTKRGKDDEKWQSVKKEVKLRDGHCRLIEVLSAREFLILQRNAGKLLAKCDPAHVIPVGVAPHMVYMSDNVCLLNRYSHEMLDYCKDPLTGNAIYREERDAWWRRIIGDVLYTKLIQESKSNGDQNNPIE